MYSQVVCAEGESNAEDTEAKVKDAKRRHEAYITNQDSKSFRPRKKYRTSVQKVMQMLDNQV